MKKITFIIFFIPVSFIITAFLLFVNDIVISVRLNELRDNLLKQNRSESSMDHIGLVSTYLINKNIYEQKISQEKADELESKIMSLAKNEKTGNSSETRIKYKMISKPAILLINFNRGIIGKAPLSGLLNQVQNIPELDTAYYYERNFLFNRAAELYGKVLENKNINNSLKASILLHQGYCYALAGMNNAAIKNYSLIINEYGNENSAVTAAILSRYLEGFNLARERVLRSITDPLQRSQDLVNLLAYKQALNILEQEEAKAGKGDIARIKYFKARCFAGMGQAEKAVDNYLQVITSSPSSQYARYSNRKIFLIGARAGGGNNITGISEQINKTIKDPVLAGMIDDQKKNPEQELSADRFEEIKIPQTLLEKIDKIIDDNKKEKKINPFMIILTSDGNTFKGTLIEKNETEISLQTSIGRINVKRNKIIKITEK
ncbi:MAG: hypothetical protein JW864_04720 [Spirochaetes bacterium]|nr:hypothetical protein [Spirochaetota bacterium]